MSAPNDGGPAFPTGTWVGECGVTEGGLTLRDYFAGQALAGWPRDDRYTDDHQTARECYNLADAMLAERERTP